jgi:hypothetical protein
MKPAPPMTAIASVKSRPMVAQLLLGLIRKKPANKGRRTLRFNQRLKESMRVQEKGYFSHSRNSSSGRGSKKSGEI